MSATDFNQKVIDEFHANDGVVGGPFDGMPILLLHHVGAKSGEQRTSPVAYLAVDDGYAIFASKGGAPTNPGWYHNLKANPQVTIEVGTETLAATADELTGDERDRIFDAQAELRPQFAEYATKTDRVIPVIVLKPER